MSSIITAEVAQAYAQKHCTSLIDITTLGQLPGTQWVCGCGQCPTPDPTPAQLQARIDQAAWRRASRLRIVVGPCPELVDGQWCTGEVVASVPDRVDRPAVMRCSDCGATWGTAQWARAGRRIMDRMREAA